MQTFTVGQLSKQANINVETVRFYEKRGLLPQPQRSESGYRLYSEQDVSRVLFIKRAKELGFTLHEISELLSLKIDSVTVCGDVKTLAEDKINSIETKIRDLNKMRRILKQLVVLCENEKQTSHNCPILESLTKT